MPGVGEGPVDEDQDLASLAPPAAHTSPTDPSHPNTSATSQPFLCICMDVWMSDVCVCLIMQMFLAVVSLMKKAPWLEAAPAC